MQNLFRLISLTLVLALLYSCSHSNDETFSYSPSSISPGGEVTVYFNADSTDLEGIDSLQLVAYSFGNNLLSTEAYDMTKDGKGFTCTFKSDEDADGIIVKFTGEEKSDNNNNEGYLIKINNPEADAGYAVALSSWGRVLDMDNNREKALELLDDTFTKSTDILKDYFDSYIGIVSRIRSEAKDSILTEKLAILEGQNDESEEILSSLVNGFEQAGNDAKADEYSKVLNEKYPQNSVKANSEYREINLLKDPDEKLAAAMEFAKKYPESDLTAVLFYYSLEDLRKAGKANKGLAVIKADPSVPHPAILSRYLNYYIDQKDYDTALELAQIKAEMSMKELENPEGDRPENLTAKEWKESRESDLGYSLFSLAQAQSKSEMNAEALVSAEKAVNLTKNEDAEVNSLYAELLIENSKYEEGLESLKGFIAAGHSNNSMKDLLKTAYNKVNGNEDGLESLISKLEEQALAGMFAELKEKMINEPAPEFELTDIDGNTVASADLKGKTIVVDFWATWCGPCRNSFPGMKQAVEKFADNENVEFLFVNSWERVDNKLENAANFIKENNYPFHVLMDTENTVITSFKVSGIPTKFVIGPDGNIRFKAIGFDGNTDKVADEVSAMIKLASES